VRVERLIPPLAFECEGAIEEVLAAVAVLKPNLVSVSWPDGASDLNSRKEVRLKPDMTLAKQSG
jgi:hypothetical protein